MTALGISSSSKDEETFFEQTPSHPTTEVSRWALQADEIFRIQDLVLSTRENYFINQEWSASLLEASILLGDAGVGAERRGEDPSGKLNEALCILLDLERKDLLQWHIEDLYRLTGDDDEDPRMERPY